MHKYGLELLLWTEQFTKENVKLIEHAKVLGFDGVEIHLGHPATIPIEDVKKALKENGMEVHFAVTLNEETNSISNDKNVRKSALTFFKKCIDVAYAISEGDCIVGGVNYAAWGYFTGKSRTKEEWEWAVKNYKKAALYAKEKNIVLGIEPVNRFETYFINTAADAV